MGWRDTIKKAEKDEQTPNEPSWRDTIVKSGDEPNPQLEQDRSIVNPAFDGSMIGATAGYAAGRGATAATEAGLENIDKGLTALGSKFSDYTPEQISRIKQNFPEYANLKPDETFFGLQSKARETNDLVNLLQKEAYEELDKKALTPSQYQSVVENTLKEPLRTSKLPAARDLSQETTRSMGESAEKGVQEFSQSKREQLLATFSELKAKEAVDNANRAELGQLPAEVQQEIYTKTKNDVLAAPNEFGFKPEIKQEELMNEYNKLLKQKTLQNSTDLVKKFPSLEGKTMAGNVESDVNKILGTVAPGADVTGSELYQMDRNLRGRGFNEQGKIESEYPAAASKSIRRDVSNLSKEAGDKLAAMSPEIKKLDTLENSGYITRDFKAQGDVSNPDFIKVEQKNVDKLVKDMITGSTTDKRNATQAIAELQKYLSPEEFDKITFSVLKQAETGRITVPAPRAGSVVNTVTSDIMKNRGSRILATIPEMAAHYAPRLTNVAKAGIKYAPKAIGALAGGGIGLLANAAEEGLDSTPTGASPDMPDYWLEKGVRNPEEQVQKARLSSFKEDLPAYNENPSGYEKPQLRKYKEDVLKAKKEGTLKDNYVTPLSDQRDNLEKLMELHNKFKSMTGSKGAEALSNTIDLAMNGTEDQKHKADFLLQQQNIVRKKLT